MSESTPVTVTGLVLERLDTPPVLAEIEVAAPGPGEVRLRMVAAGLCHTDLAMVRDARSTPMLLGHEGAGVVEAVGPDVTSVSVGDPVLVCWKVPCGCCRRCAEGRLHLCEQVRCLREPRAFRDGQPVVPMLNAGCFSELVVLPAEAAVPVDPGLPLEHAALVGCAVSTGVGAVLRTARVEPGSSVAVFGAGGVGLNVVAGARLAHARAIAAIDPDPQRRRLAREWGATHTAAPETAAEVIAAATQSRGVDYAFEVVGEPAVLEAAFDALAPGGELVVVGAQARDASFAFRPRAFMSKQQRITGSIYGSLRPHADLPLLLDWCRRGLLTPGQLISERIDLEQLPERFAGARSSGIRTVVVFEETAARPGQVAVGREERP